MAGAFVEIGVDHWGFSLPHILVDQETKRQKLGLCYETSISDLTFPFVTYFLQQDCTS